MTGAIRGEIADAVGRVTIDHPTRRNALTARMWTELRELVQRWEREDACRCIVICGGAAGGAFAAGADISEFERERSTREQVARYHEQHVGACVNAILECAIPTVAMIDGACMGGGLEIASVCDIRIASRESSFGIPIARMGFPLAFGETELLFKLVGRAVAAELLLAGRIYAADEARQAGLVQRVVDRDALEREAMGTAAAIAATSPLAARSNKRQLLRLLRDWSPVSEAERAQVYEFAQWDDYREGYEAFLAKRAPRFRGR